MSKIFQKGEESPSPNPSPRQSQRINTSLSIKNIFTRKVGESEEVEEGARVTRAEEEGEGSAVPKSDVEDGGASKATFARFMHPFLALNYNY